MQLALAVLMLGQAGAAPCNLTGHWKWTASNSLDIQIEMSSADTFRVTLHPDIDWHNATGQLEMWWNGKR